MFDGDIRMVILASSYEIHDKFGNYEKQGWGVRVRVAKNMPTVTCWTVWSEIVKFLPFSLSLQDPK